MNAPLGVILMTYGSPASLEDVAAYVTRVRGGRAPSDEVAAEFRRRYLRIGWSPLVRITQEQAAAAGEELRRRHSPERTFLVRAGMRFSDPTIGSALRELVGAGSRSVLGIIMSPQYSPLIMSGYERAIADAAAQLDPPTRPEVRVAGAWHLLPSFLDALAHQVRLALDAFEATERDAVHVVFSAHSMPKSVVDREPDYVEQLRATAVEVADRLELGPDRWTFAYQSAGHTPEEWLKPDLKDVLAGVRASGRRRVLIAPVQFLADHLETLYDVDVAAREQATEFGVELVRAPAFNASPVFAAVLADVVEREMGIGASS